MIPRGSTNSNRGQHLEREANSIYRISDSLCSQSVVSKAQL